MKTLIILGVGWALNVIVLLLTKPKEDRSADEKILDPLIYLAALIPYLVCVFGLFGCVVWLIIKVRGDE